MTYTDNNRTKDKTSQQKKNKFALPELQQCYIVTFFICYLNTDRHTCVFGPLHIEEAILTLM